MSQHFDLFVIGAGSGGVACARASAALGARVAIAEDDRLGGTCVNRGCVPKKFYVFASHYSEEFHNSLGFGWNAETRHFDWSRLKDNVFTEVDRLNGVYNTLLKRFNVTQFRDYARFVDAGTVKVGNQVVTADRFVIATGSRPFVPTIEGAELGITSDQAFHLEQLPQRISIVGGGYIATEFASIFNGLGVQTSLLLRGNDLLRGFDDDLRCHLHHELQRKGVHIRSGTNLVKIEKTKTGLHLHCQGCEDQQTDLLMFATGRVPNSQRMGLQELGLALDEQGAIAVDETGRTNIDGLYAIGDVTNRYNLTPVAIHEGRAFASSQFGGKQKIVSYDNIPTTIFSQPPLGTVGLSEEEARQTGRPIDIYRSTFKAMKYALGGIEERTLMKLVVDAESDRVLGVHMVGPDAAEIIQGFAVALKAEATKETFDNTVGIHPSLAEEFVTMREKADPKEGLKI